MGPRNAGIDDINTNIYDVKSKTWLDKDKVPSNEKYIKTFIGSLIIEKDTVSEFVRVGFKHESPDIAAEWTRLVIKDLNDAIRKQDIDEAESSIAYLKQQAVFHLSLNCVNYSMNLFNLRLKL